MLIGLSGEEKDVLHDGCFDNQTIIQSKLLSSSLNCAVIKNESTTELQAEKKNRRQVSRMLPITISLSQSRRAGKVRNRVTREEGRRGNDWEGDDVALKAGGADELFICVPTLGLMKA
jgi:hypothetical protein